VEGADAFSPCGTENPSAKKHSSVHWGIPPIVHAIDRPTLKLMGVPREVLRRLGSTHTGPAIRDYFDR
jgi:hypothetical protein